MHGYGMPGKLAFSFIKYGARDHARVPMAWDDSANGGFNKGQATWQCVNPLYKTINVKNDLNCSRSIYRYYQKLLEIKKNDQAAIYGSTEEYDHDNRKIVAYSRNWEGRKLFVMANFSKKPVRYVLPEGISCDNILLNNYERLSCEGNTVSLQPYQAVVCEVFR